MIRIASRTLCAAIAIAVVALPLAAQTTAPEDRIQQLEKRLDDLTRQVGEIRDELTRLKGTPAAAPAPAPAPTDAEDLTKIDIAPTTTTTPAAQPAAASSETASALTDVQTVNNAANPGASKVFNPDTSVIGNFLGHAGQRNDIEFGDDRRAPFRLDEAEIAFEAFVDPYAKAKFFFSVTPEGIDVEEGYANFIALPYGLTAKVGKMKSLFGKDNTWHTHVRPWADQPLVIHNFFGDEGLNDSGVSVSKTFDNPWNAYIEATGEAFSGNVENVFHRQSQNDLFYNTHLKVFRDLTENNNLEVGTSYATGKLDGGVNSFAGVDVTYRWKPLSQGLYKSFIARMEAIANDNPGFDRKLKGFYASADYQLGQRWFTGVRIDAADRAAADIVHDRGISATLTFWPSEFSQLRGQLRRTHYGDIDRSVTELLLQLQFAIGAHGAHTF
jgi:hypothetical protein